MLLKATVVQSNLKQDFGDLKCCHTPVLQPQSSGWTEALGGTLKTAVDTPVINMAFLIGAQKSGILQPNIEGFGVFIMPAGTGLTIGYSGQSSTHKTMGGPLFIICRHDVFVQ